MLVKNILNAIQEMKLDVASSDVVEVRMEHLEELYLHIKDLCSQIKEIEKVSDGRAQAINNLKDKISLMNSVTKDLIVKPKLDTYM